MSQQYTPPSSAGSTAEIPNYLIPAIVATIFCCIPVGVVSIIFATQVNNKIAAGDIAGAMEASQKAKKFMFITIGAGLAVWIICIILWVFVFGMAVLTSH
jgi:hypothetical protein